MLTPRKKFSRKELHKDPLLDKIATASELAQTHKQKLTAVALGVVVVAALIYGYFNYRSERNEESINKLAAPEQTYFSGDYREAIRRLEKYCAEYEGTQGGGMATFYLANAYYNTDQFDFALERYKMYVDDYSNSQLLTVSSMIGIAACYEGQNKYQEAVDQYKKVIDKFSDVHERPECMMSLARCYKILNQSENAKAWYSRVVKDFPESGLARDAKQALDELGA
jgi:outer membrane protein assembly factor BamD (BamD/ComL family)